MTTMKPEAWTTTTEWEEVVSHVHHADFRQALSDAARDGLEVVSVTVIGGVPVSYRTRSKDN